ncbi:uncharacterized protein CBO05P2_147 [Clostridium botulinum B str. Osaka05]|uniref:Uncharacterized protein n=1 Tax=Clostridium botulinum B str. Osaka05 TaxID=1407017 RepID=A0A060N5Q7_CLOBO|nr:uncharacterized protein CBO05P2_147 [Clostridium botulinum B str. Osaka05]
MYDLIYNHTFFYFKYRNTKIVGKFSLKTIYILFDIDYNIINHIRYRINKNVRGNKYEY